jgi:hypothetical protein
MGFWTSTQKDRRWNSVIQVTGHDVRKPGLEDGRSLPVDLFGQRHHLAEARRAAWANSFSL